MFSSSGSKIYFLTMLFLFYFFPLLCPFQAIISCQAIAIISPGFPIPTLVPARLFPLQPRVAIHRVAFMVLHSPISECLCLKQFFSSLTPSYNEIRMENAVLCPPPSQKAMELSSGTWYKFKQTFSFFRRTLKMYNIYAMRFEQILSKENASTLGFVDP